MNYTGAQPVTATAPVTLIGQFSISVNIYNSAGEVVKTIKVQDFSVPIDNISLSTSNTITTLQGSGSTIDILYDGVVIGTWDGSNNSNNPVANGTYRITLSSVGSSQVVTTVSQNAIVNRNITNVEADIYNSAGELVRKLYNVITDGKGTTMTNVVLSSGVLSPGASNPSAASVTIFVQNTDTPVTLLWDGTNDESSYVSPGEYQIHIHCTNGDASTTDITKTILVLPQSGSNGKVLAEPNEIKGSTTSTIFNGAAVNGASSLKVNIYTTSGELVQALSSSLPAVGWTPNGLASGIYIASVEVDNANGGLLSRQNVKVLILH
jgi:flagellar hook assembly protein FlgD